jgi:hypothetical protein
LDNNNGFVGLDKTSFFTLLDTPLNTRFNIFIPLSGNITLVNEGEDATMEMRLTSSLFITSNEDNGLRRSVFGGKAGRMTRLGKNND